ncbi:putative F-box domain, leucine-rich repeat domain, L domain-containing protein [Rosa chinensis]|uniref:Putative F-box domain, leucine-rich repeat domain, L domain-containing protein n=1 Tax=Rosa chinensis TaxID=74649 RepID=A0A2P6RQF3_ROSCH|nr:F-box/FBD/LRR-repeat protein At1g13780 [Rosa chinensis]PRQ48654.1 putative F-box domain, leucine-rich repeat domain, L domain-containing protein [Rosa chinensis]
MALELPDLVIHQILQFLPTKSAVRLSFLSKQWEGVWSSAPIIDFDEGGEDGNNNLSQHKRFVKNILSRYLEFLVEKEKEKQGLEKFKLHMTRYLSGDASIVTKLLSSSFERGVKELDISLRVSKSQWDHWSGMKNYNNLSPMELINAKSAARIKNYYYFSRTALANAKSLTTLNLGSVRIKNISFKECSTSTCLLPSLKSMSLKKVHFDKEALFYLIRECSCIEYLSIISCSFKDGEFRVSSSSLKSLQVEHCDSFAIQVDDAVNLESLTIVSDIGPPQLPNFHSIILKDCFNLKCLHICAPQVKVFDLDGCHDVKGTIDAPLLDSITFKGYLSSKLSLKAPNLSMTRIVLFDKWDSEAATFNSRPWNHFTTLSNFLEEFGSSKTLDLYVSDFKALMFPKNFRKTLSSPIFPSLKKLYFSVKNPPRKMNKELSDSLYWMAPDVLFIKNLPWRIRHRPL